MLSPNMHFLWVADSHSEHARKREYGHIFIRPSTARVRHSSPSSTLQAAYEYMAFRPSLGASKLICNRNAARVDGIHEARYSERRSGIPPIKPRDKLNSWFLVLGLCNAPPHRAKDFLIRSS
jgi:hypothetical protein